MDIRPSSTQGSVSMRDAVSVGVHAVWRSGAGGRRGRGGEGGKGALEGPHVCQSSRRGGEGALP